MTPLRIFIGWDPREAAAYHVLCHSLMQHASCPISITPLMQGSLRRSGVYWRTPDLKASTEFSLTRFLVPHLCDYQGYAVFMDCDMLCQADIRALFDICQADGMHSVYCVKHDYTPATDMKMDGCRQSVYPRKNWSSVMVFNNDRCRMLSPEYVNRATPADLHQFRWMPDEEVGTLAYDWNWLVGEYVAHPDAALLHYTLGGPWFENCQGGPEAGRWIDAYKGMRSEVLSSIS
jgi:hypothetical protein